MYGSGPTPRGRRRAGGRLPPRTRIRRRRSGAAILLLAVTISGASCSSSGSTAKPAGARSTVPSKAPAAKPHAVREVTVAFLDRHRPTAANGGVAAQLGRRLPTTIYYPADRGGGPYPLIVFAHGLGSSGVEYSGLLRRWVAAGFVVAAPRFPLTNNKPPGGISPGDYVNQPADVSYVITAVLQAATGPGPLAGLVDPNRVGAAGHSLGGITTLGLAANTCCTDGRVKAAIVMSGDSIKFPEGRFDYTKAPPLLFVHGSADPLVPYESSVDAFNLAQGPKGLVTVVGGDHSAPVDPGGKAFVSVVRITTDFFDAYLYGDEAAASRLESDAEAGVTRVVFGARAGSQTTVPTTPPAPVRLHHAAASATTGLTNAQPVTITWSDYTPGKTVNIVQCSKKDSTDVSACDLKHAALLQPDPSGAGTATIHVVVGAVGTGTCDATHSNCVIVVNDGGSLDESASVRIPISFAAG